MASLRSTIELRPLFLKDNKKPEARPVKQNKWMIGMKGKALSTQASVAVDTGVEGVKGASG